MGTVKETSPFDAIVFAGGGSRCFWQMGFYETAAPALGIMPDQIAAASAGSAIALTLLAGKNDEAMDIFCQMTAMNGKNIYPSNILKGKPPFPHYRMYSEILSSLIDEKVLKHLRSAPSLRVIISRPPRFLGPRSATVTGIATYSLEKTFRYPVHPAWPAAIGFTPEVVTAQDVWGVDEMVQLVLASSSTPPMVPVINWDGRPALDGGLVDNVPVRALHGEPSRTLVLLTRQYPEKAIPATFQRLYVQPSRPIPISKWDYTSPEGLREARALGQEDGEKFARAFQRGDYSAVG